jgi:hypothetical protein
MTSKESLNLINMAQISKNSSTRAYTGHAHEMRSIFDINSLNLTEFARSFGLYKNLAQMVTITTKNFEKASKKEKQESSKKRFFSNAIEKEE